MSERDWERLGQLSEGLRVGPVAASREGYGLLGTTVEPPAGALSDRMRGRRAHLIRVTRLGLERVYEGPGWIQAVDCQGPLCAVLGATLRAVGAGSDYHLLLSTDGGRHWSVRGPVAAPSAAQVLVVSADEIWVLGALFLGRTADGGATWTEVSLEGERNAQTERLRRVERGVAVLGKGLLHTHDGGATWGRESSGATRLVDVDGAHVLAVEQGLSRIGERRGAEVRWVAPLPANREPLRLVGSGPVLRVLTRNAEPGKGVQPAVHTSQDSGKSWATHALPVGPHVDIAGQHGLGTDLRGQVFGHLS